MKEIRKGIFSEEFWEFYENSNQKVRGKIDYVLHIIKTQKVVNEKFVKKLQNSIFYEMRVSVGKNEYRSILFAMDNENFTEASTIFFLNTFLKKNNNDYKKAIEKALTILNKYEDENNE